jgi:signal transduction histidine kinase
VKRKAPTLSAIVVRRIVFFSAVAMLVQFVAVVARYWLDDQELGHLVVEHESHALAAGITHDASGDFAFALPDSLRSRYGQDARGYFARIRTGSDKVLFSNCNADCGERFLPLNLDPPDFWMKQLAPGKPLEVAGGAVVDNKTEPVFVEVAVIGDKESVLTAVLARETVDHMIAPMCLIFVVVLGATTLSIMQALGPVTRVANLVSDLNPLALGARLPTRSMPLEIAQLTTAINSAFFKMRELVHAQKVFTSAISHEVKTPLAVARLELEKIADPRARKVEQDLEALNRLVEQLTTLARLEGADLAPPEPVQPGDVAEGVVSALAPLVFAAGKTIALIDKGGTSFHGYPTLVENALRNLVENAIRHTGAETQITVEVGPGAAFLVCGDETNANTAAASPVSAEVSHGLGLGLKIVRRIAKIHGGWFELIDTPSGAMAAHIVFVPAEAG